MLLLMHTTGLVEIVNITGLSLRRNLHMLSAHRVCALESSSLKQYTGRHLNLKVTNIFGYIMYDFGLY